MQGAPQERAGQVLRSRSLPNNALNPTGIKRDRTVQNPAPGGLALR